MTALLLAPDPATLGLATSSLQLKWLTMMQHAAAEAAASPLGGALLGGGTAGCVAKTATAPLARLTLLMQTSGLSGSAAFKDCGVVNGIKRIVKKGGVLALWKGNTCTCVHRFWSTGINFATFERCRSADVFGNSTLGRFFSGALATGVAVSICYPLDLVRSRQMVDLTAQDSSGGIFRTLVSIRANEGVRGLFRGLGPALCSSVPPVAISFCTYGQVRDFLCSKGLGDDSMLATILAGGSSGVLGSATTFPFGVVQRRLQVTDRQAVAHARNAREEFAHIFRTEGVRGYYRGLQLEMAGVFPYVAILFLAYESFKLKR
eukprot:TRINITY_DN23450_c0_g1_i1.p1 TRINITY_DN23450_c0_g1~~TRINITY_DN23450_c0_g1_i1.p1  ORF type:complete len:319 (-),score=61.45 TRINITY_DN23450_c0_g1_i1:389-1345(-)